MWTGTKVSKAFTVGRGTIVVVVEFSDGTDSFNEVYKSAVIPPDWPDSLIRAREAELNALDLDKITLGVRDDAPVAKPPDPPTQEQLDRQARFETIREATKQQRIKDLSAASPDFTAALAADPLIGDLL